MYFPNKPELNLDDNAILAFVCLRNEAQRLPYFLEYYQKLGVSHFFIIDNQSDDDSAKIIDEHPLSTRFFADGSYKGSAAGRLWMEELANHYGINHWCFTVDVDELFVYPFMESTPLNSLIDSLNEERAEGMMSVFLDMYSDKPLSETNYQPGTDFLDTCPFYEVSTYSLSPAALPPYLSVTGGPRWRSLWDRKKVNSGPMMKKVPLVKWQEGFFYNYSTHSHFPLKLSNTTAVLQHFKFFSFFSELAQKEALRGDRRQTKDYQNYADKLSTDDPCFLGTESKRYTSSLDFIRAGIICVSENWRRFASQNSDSQTELLINSTTSRPSDNSIVNLTSSGMGLGSLAYLWPHVNNESAFEIKHGYGKRLRSTDITMLVERHASNLTLIDIRKNALLIKIEPLIWTQQHCKFTLVASSNGLVIECFDIDKNSCYQNILSKSFDAGIHTFTLSEGGPLQRYVQEYGAIRPRITFSLMAEAAGDAQATHHYEGLACSEAPAMKAIKKGRLNYFDYQQGNAGSLAAGQMFDGVLESVTDGVVRGWVVEKLPSNPLARFNWDIPVSIYLNDWYVGETTHTYSRKDLSYKRLKRQVSGQMAQHLQTGYGFDFPLPINFFFDKGISEFTLELRVARRNVVLSRSPCQWSGRSARWNKETKQWTNADTNLSVARTA